MKNGVARVGGKERKVKPAGRKTAIGKAKAYQMEKERVKSDMVYQASLNMKENIEEGDSDWESAEEDAPAVRLEELLSNMKIEDSGSDKEEEKEES